MTITRYETNQRWSKAVVHNGTVYFCGQVAKELVPDVAEQTRTTLEKIDDLLTSVGSDKSKIISATIYLKDITTFKEMNEVWDSWVPEGCAPARACIEGAATNPDELVEICIIAAVD
jgi:enamine deaminase RidA (YjgF/YER057c/UK114 family)